MACVPGFISMYVKIYCSRLIFIYIQGVCRVPLGTPPFSTTEQLVIVSPGTGLIGGRWKVLF